jgi:hypothetical protein
MQKEQHYKSTTRAAGMQKECWKGYNAVSADSGFGPLSGQHLEALRDLQSLQHKAACV